MTKYINVDVLPSGKFKVTIGKHKMILDDKEIVRLADYCSYAMQDKGISGEDDSYSPWLNNNKLFKKG